jgi:hypothetical protein
VVTTPSTPTPLRRSAGLAALVGVGIGLTTTAVLYALLAIPFYALARATEGEEGLNRDFFRDGLMRIALPAGVVLGLLSGVLVGVWYARGGRLPDE